MRKRNILSLLLVVVLILMAAPIVLAQYSPEVFTVDQDVVNGTVKVTRATINGPGWVVIHADADGERAVFLPEFGAGIGCEVAPGHRPLTGEPVRGHGFDGALPVGLAGRGCLAVPKQYGGKDRSNDDQGAVQLGWGKIVHGRSSPMA